MNTKILTLSLAMTFGSLFASAQNCCHEVETSQDRPRPTCGAPYDIKEYTPCETDCTACDIDPYQDMNITEDQKAQIQKAVDKRDAKNEKIRQRMEKDRAKAQAEFDKEIKKILTESQYRQFRQNIGSAPVRRHVAKPVPGPQPQLMK